MSTDGGVAEQDKSPAPAGGFLSSVLSSVSGAFSALLQPLEPKHAARLHAGGATPSDATFEVKNGVPVLGIMIIESVAGAVHINAGDSVKSNTVHQKNSKEFLSGLTKKEGIVVVEQLVCALKTELALQHKDAAAVAKYEIDNPKLFQRVADARNHAPGAAKAKHTALSVKEELLKLYQVLRAESRTLADEVLLDNDVSCSKVAKELMQSTLFFFRLFLSNLSALTRVHTHMYNCADAQIYTIIQGYART